VTTIRVSIVSYFSNADELTATVESLCAGAAKFDGQVQLVLTDNTDHASDSDRLSKLVGQWIDDGFLGALSRFEFRQTGKNLGYGQANNAALLNTSPTASKRPGQTEPTYLLVLNPDLRLNIDSLDEATNHMSENPECVLLTPRALSLAGDDLFLNHARPTILALLGRFMKAPAWLKPLRVAMDKYEMRDLPADQPHEKTICASGCFMWARANAFEEIGGFDARFFMYFEDYDLTARLRQLGQICYEPRVLVTHFGGGAASKGFAHSRMFATSAFRFFQRHGWHFG
jgi:GT2 family glycosyltransferase